MTDSGLFVDVHDLEVKVDINTGEPGQWEVFVTNPALHRLPRGCRRWRGLQSEPDLDCNPL